MKINCYCFLANGNPFLNLADCSPKIMQRISILFEAGDESSKMFEAVNKFHLASTKTSYNSQAYNGGITLEGPAATKLFLSDLKYNVLPNNPDLATFKAIVLFDPTNKKLMSLESICNSVRCHSKGEIEGNYDQIVDLIIAEQKSEREQPTQEQCAVIFL